MIQPKGKTFQSRKDLLDLQNDEKSGQHIETRDKLTVDRLNNLKKEIGYLEREMQRLKNTVTRLQLDPTQTRYN